MKRVRAGEPVSPAELLRFAQLFSDELTLDNLERVQLSSLCRFVGISPFGTDAFLRARLRAHLGALKSDDREIEAEGLEALSDDELRAASRARGMRAPFGPGAAAFMRAQLAEWLDWSLHRSLPSSLLLLSRAFTVTSPTGLAKPCAVDDAALRETLSTLPDEVIEDAELRATASGDRTEELERKLGLLAREEELIAEEAEAAALAAADEALSGAPPAERLEAGEGFVAGALEVGRSATDLAATAAAHAALRAAAAGSVADALEGLSAEERAAGAAATKERRMRGALTALAALASSSGVAGEREAFMDLVEKEIGRLNSTLEARGAAMSFTRGRLQTGAGGAAVEEALGQKRLEGRVAGMLKRVERRLDEAETSIGDRLRVLDRDNDGVVSAEELRFAMASLREQLGEDELRALLEALQAEAGARAPGGGFDVARLMDLALNHSKAEGEGKEGR
jgi:LETM1 and EF-hand domain-containing protein 1